ncbi:505aeaae-2d89-42e1-a88c-b0b659619966 [Thermothielavioides terrestris]|uniref:505aeaae-2d89-42e1-a88c-b0b659619966 n=1 Tax=Thermothielavioides terrestris TaxID=2587410 RepID=A0A446BR68_9PEZI|nr:505aeaae-2d89-42e1-a88c-b0b659619966 [Thermothielavioides terrestris]
MDDTWVDTQELRRRFTNKTNAVFSRSDWHDDREYAAVNYERVFDFSGCKDIIFQRGREDDVLMLAHGSGHMTLPAGVRVRVLSGYARCAPAAPDSVGSGSTVVGSGVRAPPPSRVSAYAHSSAGSGYARSSAGSAYAPSAASFHRGGARSSYMSACGVPLPPSEAGSRSMAGSANDWVVVEEMEGYGFQDDRDNCSIAPSESISSVGSRAASRWPVSASLRH